MIFEHYCCDGDRFAVGEGEGDPFDSEFLCYFQRPSGEVHGWALARRAANFEFGPGEAVLDSSAKGLGCGFFCSEAGGEALGTVLLAMAVVDFGGRKNALQKARTVAFDGAGDALDLDHIYARSNQHDGQLI